MTRLREDSLGSNSDVGKGLFSSKYLDYPFGAHLYFYYTVTEGSFLGAKLVNV